MCNSINILEKIKKAKKIMIVFEAKKLSLASALYTYILTKHKSVVLVCEDESLDARLSFLPWFKKVKSKKILNADLEIEINFNSLDFFSYMKNESMKINKKMATSLYAELLQESDGFLNPDINGIVFTVAKELINCGAEYKLCTKNLLQTKSLALLRLKSLMFKSMTLHNNAKAAIFSICDNDLKSSGAIMHNCDEVLKEALYLPLVELAVLLDSKNEIIKIKET